MRQTSILVFLAALAAGAAGCGSGDSSSPIPPICETTSLGSGNWAGTSSCVCDDCWPTPALHHGSVQYVPLLDTFAILPDGHSVPFLPNPPLQSPYAMDGIGVDYQYYYDGSPSSDSYVPRNPGATPSPGPTVSASPAPSPSPSDVICVPGNESFEGFCYEGTRNVTVVSAQYPSCPVLPTALLAIFPVNEVGSAITDATASLTDSNGDEEALQSEGGIFPLSWTQTGSYWVTLQAPGYGPVTRELRVSPAACNPLQTYGFLQITLPSSCSSE